MNDGFKILKKRNFFFKKALSLKRLDKFVRSRVKLDKNGIIESVDRASMHPARLDASNGCALTTLSSELGCSR